MHPVRKILPVIVLLVGNCFAGVVPISIYFSNTTGQDTYTVPAGKVLIVESLRQNVGTSGITAVYINVEQTYVNDGGSVTFSQQFSLSTSTASGRLLYLEKPFRLSEGAIVTKPSINSPETTQYYISGLLMDASDLYAANIDTEMKVAAVSNTVFLADVELASSRPATVRVDQSDDLVNWSPVPPENIKATLDGDRRTVEVDVVGDYKFLRSSAVARK